MQKAQRESCVLPSQLRGVRWNNGDKARGAKVKRGGENGVPEQRLLMGHPLPVPLCHPPLSSSRACTRGPSGSRAFRPIQASRRSASAVHNFPIRGAACFTCDRWPIGANYNLHPSRREDPTPIWKCLIERFAEFLSFIEAGGYIVGDAAEFTLQKLEKVR